MKKVVFCAFLVLGFMSYADEPSLQAADTVRQVVSPTITEKAWRRDVVTVDALGDIVGDGGVVGTVVETKAIDTVATNATAISEAATIAMTNAMAYVTTKTNNMARSGVGFALAFAPETDDVNIRGFVVKTETTGGVDTQWVWYNSSFATAPSRYVTYTSVGKSAMVKCNWGTWKSEGTNIVHNGTTWTGVHKCTVQRPTWAVGKSCLDEPNETWGGENGMDFGSVVLMKDESISYYTGFVTNTVQNLVAYFDNGFLKAIVPLNESED